MNSVQAKCGCQNCNPPRTSHSLAGLDAAAMEQSGISMARVDTLLNENGELENLDPCDPMHNEVMTIPQVLQTLGKVKTAIIKQNQEDNKALKGAILEKIGQEIATVASATNEIYTLVSSAAYDYAAPGGKKRARAVASAKIPLSKPPPFLDLITNPEFGNERYLKFLLLSTVYSFVRSVPSLRSWLSDDAWRNPRLPIFAGVSGLSLIYFAVRNNDTKARLKLPAGLAVAQLMHLTLANKIDAARKSFNGNGGPNCNAPDWIQSFKSSRRTMEVIVDVLVEKEKKRNLRCGSDSSSAVDTVDVAEETPLLNKRRRTLPAGRAELQFAVPQVVLDPHAHARKFSVRTAKSKLARWLSTARCDSRKKLFTSVMFLVEKIHSFPTPAAARDSGFYISFDPNTDVDYAGMDDVRYQRHEKWKIPLANIDESDPMKMYQDNLRSFNALKTGFPSLTVQLHYRRDVIRTTQDAADGSTEWNEEGLSWAVMEHCSLHALATKVLLSASKVEAFNDILSSSPYSLRAVHVLAVGLLGALRQAVGEHPSSVELAALGKITTKHVKKDDILDTLLYGGATKEKDGGTDCLSVLQQMRREKLEMSWSDYKAAKEKLDDGARRAESTRSSVTESFPGSMGDGDASEDEDFWAFADKVGTV